MKTTFIFLIIIFAFGTKSHALHVCKNKEFSYQIQEKNSRSNWDSIPEIMDSTCIVVWDDSTNEELSYVRDSIAWQCEMGISIDAEFPGGMSALNQYIIDNIETGMASSKFKANCVKVYVQFTIDEQGIAKNVSITHANFELFNEQVLKLINEMPPWTPAVYKGKKIASIFTLPIQIYLN